MVRKQVVVEESQNRAVTELARQRGVSVSELIRELIDREIARSRNDSVQKAAGTLPLRVIVPFTGWKDHFSSAPWLVHVAPDDGNGLIKESAADTIQVRPVSERRFVTRLGMLSEADVRRIEDGVRLVLGL